MYRFVFDELRRPVFRQDNFFVCMYLLVGNVIPIRSTRSS